MIRVHDLTFAYPHANWNLFEKASLEIPDNCMTCLTGPNGSGKTTLFHLIHGSPYYPYDGRIEVDCPRHRRQLLVQHAWLPQLLTCGESMRWAFALSGTDPAWGRVEFLKLLHSSEREKLRRILNRRVGKISTGERQWFTVRLGLFLGNDLVLLDEPTNGMDKSTRFQFYDSLLQARNSGKTILLTTHFSDELIQDMDFLVEIRERKFLLKPGSGQACHGITRSPEGRPIPSSAIPPSGWLPNPNERDTPNH